MFRQICTLSFSFVLLLNIVQFAHAVPIDGRDWMQVSETVNFTYNNLAGGPCDVVTGVCTGSASNHLGTTLDLTGWVWASSSDIADLFEYLTGAPDGTFDADVTSFAQSLVSASWAADVIDSDGAGPDTGLFDATASFSSDDHWVAGLTRSIVGGNVDRSYIRTAGYNLAVVGNPIGVDTARSHTGVWLFKPSSVPEPMPLTLLGVGLAVLGLRSRFFATAA